jgi:hypothetical protein
MYDAKVFYIFLSHFIVGEKMSEQIVNRLEECLKSFGIKKVNNIMQLKSEDNEIYKVCMRVVYRNSDNDIVMVDGSDLSAEKLAEVVRYLKSKNIKFAVLT